MSRSALARSNKGELTKYDPEKGLNKIAVLQAAEKRFAQAKDASKLQQAIRAKLEAQAEFVFWWDTQVEKSKGGRPSQKPVSDLSRVFEAGKDGLPDRQTIQRWRKKLNDPDKFETTYESACQRYAKILEFQTTAHVGHNSGENEWYTPKEYIEAARAVLGEIDLYPASNDVANQVVKAAQIFTPDDDGLEQRWDGRVWMNPPYAQPLITDFANKLAQSVREQTVTAACVLVNNATETAWFRAIADVSNAICFPSGRVRFWNPSKESATPLQGQAVLYAGPDVAKFCSEFASFGFLVEVRR